MQRRRITATPQRYWEDQYLHKTYRKNSQPFEGVIFECVGVDSWDGGRRVRLDLEEKREDGFASVMTCSRAFLDANFRACSAA